MATQKSSRIWITHAWLVTQDSRRQVFKRNLVIEGGRIAAITSRKPPASTPRAQIINASGLFILPGFIQAHIHLCQTLFRNQADDLELMDWLSKKIWVMEAAHTPETLYTSALLGIYELLASGTTTLLDMGTVRHTDSIFKAVRDTGIRASVGKCLMDHPTTTPTYLRESTNEALEEALELYQRWNGAENDRIRASFAPRFVVSCTEDLLRRIAKISHSRGALVHTHASENPKEIKLVKKLVGIENVEYLHKLNLTSKNLVLAHCVWLNQREKKILKKSGTHVVHCPSSNLKLASGIAPVPELRRLGVNVALGADGAPCNNNLDVFREMRLAALLHKPGSGPRAMRAHEVLDMATRDGARALGWWKDIGSIEIGKKADLIALDLRAPENALPGPQTATPSIEAIASSIVYASSPAHLRWSMIDGEIRVEDGRVKGIDPKALMDRVQRAQKVIQRSPQH